MTSVGEVLRTERTRRNLGLDQVSRELKISRKLLEAIEEDRFDKLPGGVFARAFVRQYARLLDLDSEELASRVQEVLGPDPVPTFTPEQSGAVAGEIRMGRFEDNIGMVGGGRTSRASVFWALASFVLVIAICSGVYTFWQYLKRPVPPSETQTVAAAKPVTPPVQPPQAPPPAVGMNPQGQPDGTQPGASIPGAPVPAPSGLPVPAGTPGALPPDAVRQESPAGVPAPGVGTQPALQTPPAPPKPVADVVDPNAPVKVELVPLAAVWVRVLSDGKYKFSGTLNPEQIRSVSANEEVVVRIGNAADLEVRLNGKPIGTLGPRGQVRTVQLTSGGFKIVPPKPAAPVAPSEPF